ncbi:MAG: glycosyltransferase family 2 protein [Magnetococcales bacterium]|nr:glycosyltransferase family 2 protein [Magnetococcales bacterium]
MPRPLSIILPVHDEAAVVQSQIRQLRARFPEAEILVVDDGSHDGSGDLARQAGARVVAHPRNLGNGAAIKSGARHATGEILVFMDADGQHAVDDIPRLLEMVTSGYAMAVGARVSRSHAGWARRIGNGVLNGFASWLTGQRIPDLTSGFRAVRAAPFRRFLYLLPNGFSYPTTITMAFMRSGLPVGFTPIVAGQRVGKSKIRLISDGTKFLLIIMKITQLFSPMRVFLPVSLLFFALGVGRYIHVYALTGRLTNMPVLLFIASLLTFLVGLLSEQVATLYYATSAHAEEQDARAQQSGQQIGSGLDEP